MAKHSKQDIFDTADQLLEDGKNPTLANVREALGGGSFTTISQAMNEWKAKQAADKQTIKEAAPEAITSRVGELSAEIWAVAQEMANARLANEREALEHSRQDMEASQKEAIDLADQLSVDLETMQAEHGKTVQDVKDANELLEATQQTNLSIQKKLDAAEIRIEESNTRMEDLRRELKHSHDDERAQREQHAQETKQLNEKLSQAQQTASDSRAAAARLEGELKQAQEEAKSQRQQHNQEMKRFNEKMEQAQQTISNYQATASGLESDLKHVKEEAQAAHEQHSHEAKKLSEQLVESQNNASDSRAAAARLEGELAALKEQMNATK